MTAWIRSSRCDAGSCLYAWPGHRTVWVRDSEHHTLIVEHADWRALIAALKEHP